MRLRFALAAILIVFSFPAEKSDAEIVMDITESGSDLLITTSGSLNMTGLSGSYSNNENYKFSHTNLDGGVTKVFGAFKPMFLNTGHGITNVTYIDNLNPTNSNLQITNVSHISGNASFGFGDGDSHHIWIPNNYVSNSQVNQVLRVNGESFASLGIEAGESVSFSWAGNSQAAGDTIRMQVSSVPEPTSFAMFGIAILGMARRRRKA